ncbi:MAG: D-alanine--D-alanine ligase [Bdellovibrionota bacterium]
MRAVILHSELCESAGPDEQDTLVQVASVKEALQTLGDEVFPLPFSEDAYLAREQLLNKQPDYVFNLTESVNGRGSLAFLAPALLSELNIPYTGCGATALHLTTDKVAAKRILRRFGIPTPPSLSLADTSADCKLLPGGKYIMKCAAEDASIGLEDSCVVTVNNGGELRSLLEKRNARTGTAHFAEQFIAGREFNIAVLELSDGFHVLPAAEIIFDSFPPDKERIVGYKAKWESDTFEYANTPRSYAAFRSEPGLCGTLADLSRACCTLFELHDYVRVDFRIDEHGRPWVLEMNPSPCIAPDSGFIAAASEAGMTYVQVIERIVARAKERVC